MLVAQKAFEGTIILAGSNKYITFAKICEEWK